MTNDRNRDTGAVQPRRGEADRSTPHGASGRIAMKVARGTLAAGMGHRPVDVICAGMYRACSTWQYEVVSHLVERHRGGRRLGYLTPEEYLRGEPDGTAWKPPAAGWRVFKSHDGHRCFDRAIAEDRAVAIYAYRDVRDVVFSLMHKRRLTFEQLLRQGMIHQVLANDRFWMRRPKVLVQRYDDILADPVGAVRALAGHLGIRPAPGEAERIAADYSLDANKARTEALRRRLEQGGIDLNEAANSLICDPKTLLHWNHVRDGRSGSWLVESTPRHRRILDRLCGAWLKAHDYPPTPVDPVASSAVPLGDRIGMEGDLLRGWLCYRARSASQHFPRLSAAVKRVLGMPEAPGVGATAWSEANGGPAR